MSLRSILEITEPNCRLNFITSLSLKFQSTIAIHRLSTHKPSLVGGFCEISLFFLPPPFENVEKLRFKYKSMRFDGVRRGVSGNYVTWWIIDGVLARDPLLCIRVAFLADEWKHSKLLAWTRRSRYGSLDGGCVLLEKAQKTLSSTTKTTHMRIPHEAQGECELLPTSFSHTNEPLSEQNKKHISVCLAN